VTTGSSDSVVQLASKVGAWKKEVEKRFEVWNRWLLKETMVLLLGFPLLSPSSLTAFRNTILQLQCSVKQITLTRKRRRLYRSEPVLIRHAEAKESDSCLDSCGVHFLLFVEKFLWVTRYLYGISRRNKVI
jgi:hypothetical protein